jgi:hypothetical protein
MFLGSALTGKVMSSRRGRQPPRRRLGVFESLVPRPVILSITQSQCSIRYREDARMFADEIGDGDTGYLIERTLDEARVKKFPPVK